MFGIKQTWSWWMSQTIMTFTSNPKHVKGHTYLSISWTLSSRSCMSLVIFSFFPTEYPKPQSQSFLKAMALLQNKGRSLPVAVWKMSSSYALFHLAKLPPSSSRVMQPGSFAPVLILTNSTIKPPTQCSLGREKCMRAWFSLQGPCYWCYESTTLRTVDRTVAN